MVKFGIVAKYPVHITSKTPKQAMAVSTGNTFIEAVGGITQAITHDIVKQLIDASALANLLKKGEFKVVMFSDGIILSETNDDISWKNLVNLNWSYKHA